MPKFKVVSPYEPSGDQPEAIKKLARGIENGLDEQILLGVTGSGKTFTMAKVIEQIQRPTLVLAHNKTLASQLCEEFRAFFPDNAVEYFVSYYDYYQPEAYIPHTDTYIAKDASTNDEIDRLRLSATCALLERRDVIVVSSVSCIYGLGEPEDFAKLMISVRVGMNLNRDELLRRLVEDRYERNDIAFERNMFRVRGDTVEIYPAYYKDKALRVEFFGDEIDRITEFNPVTGAAFRLLEHAVVYPASHYVTTKDKMDRAIGEIRREMEEQVQYFTERNKLVEAQRIRQRTEYDIEMMTELGYCSGIENYSRIISERPSGSAPMDGVINVLQFQHSAIPPCAFWIVRILSVFFPKSNAFGYDWRYSIRKWHIYLPYMPQCTRKRLAAYDERENRTSPKNCFARRGMR